MKTQTRHSLRLAARRALHGDLRVPDSVKRTEVYQSGRYQCDACLEWVAGVDYDCDKSLCQRCAGELEAT